MTVLLEPYLQTLSVLLAEPWGREGSRLQLPHMHHRGSLASYSQGGRDTTHHPGIPVHGSVSVRV